MSESQRKHALEKKHQNEDNRMATRELQRAELREFEENLPAILEERSQQMGERLSQYVQKLEDGERAAGLTSLVISNMLFAPLMGGRASRPAYTAEKLALAYEVYSQYIMEVNQRVGKYVPSLWEFCHFLGITESTFKNYKEKNPDVMMREQAEYIETDLLNMQITAAQFREIDSITTIHRSKIESGRIEPSSTVVVRHEGGITFEDIKDRVSAIKQGRTTEFIDVDSWEV